MKEKFSKYWHYWAYRVFHKIPCPYCYRNTYAGLAYRHERSLSTKKMLAKSISRRLA